MPQEPDPKQFDPYVTVLEWFRKSAGLAPPPSTLSKTELRLVDLIDEYLRMVRLGWDIPSDYPKDRWVPGVSPSEEQEAPIIQYLIDLGFGGDALRLKNRMQRYRRYLNHAVIKPSWDDDEQWKEFHKQYLLPLSYEASLLSSDLCEVRAMIVKSVKNVRVPDPPKPKRSTQKGEAESKLNSALTDHHQYAEGGCINWEPINSNVLAKNAGVAKASANRFFNKWFGSAKKARDGHENYMIACNVKGKLIAILKTLNDEMPRPGEVLFGNNVPDEAENPEHQIGKRRKPRAREQRSHDDD